MSLRAPFAYFGGKSRVAAEVWRRFGDVRNYVEPFAGSLAVLLARPTPFEGVETVNDADALLANFWRAMVKDPEGVVRHADWPVNEADIHARHLWLLRMKETLADRVMANPDFYDITLAGWWVWGISAKIGGGWCSGEGPWVDVEGRFVRRPGTGKGVVRGLPRLCDYGSGINRRRTIPPGSRRGASEILLPVAERLKNVRVACGDWTRVVSKSVTWGHGLTAVFLDPPYPDGSIDYNAGNRSTYQDVQSWAVENGNNPMLRIAVCGYEGDHDRLTDEGWSVHEWKAGGGYGNQGNKSGRKNAARERVWFSPHCLP